MSIITILGRGHSGTRMLSHTLYASGVFMGLRLNPSGDKLPAQDLYAACRVMGRHVTWSGDRDWEFGPLHSMPIDPEFKALVDKYLADVSERDAKHKGWKVPETTLVFPWIVRLFPEVSYIYIVRDPRDVILDSHYTDQLRDFGVPAPEVADIYERRAVSWLYQYEIVKATPKPARFFSIRFEDFILHQEETLERLEEFLNFPLARIIVRPDAVGRWRSHEQGRDFPFLHEAMREQGYIS